MTIKVRDAEYPEDFIEVDALVHNGGYVEFLVNVPPGDVPHITVSKRRWEELKEYIDSRLQSRDSLLLTLMPHICMLVLGVHMFAWTINMLVWGF